MKKLLFLFLFFTLYYVHPQIVRADYVLPYPSYMPGNKLYTVSKIFERVESWWYWGAIGQTKYHMMLADKYLVEAKTLFEYKQYVLAIKALQSSNEHISEVPKYITLSERQGKNMTQFTSLFEEEEVVHRTVLGKLQAELPKTFLWTPEKESATTLDIGGLLSRAITLRTQQ